MIISWSKYEGENCAMTKICQKGQLADWPTDHSKKMLDQFKKVSDSVGTALDPNKVEDITHEQEARLQLLTFLPKINLLGPELWFERRRKDKEATWGGVFVRALSQKDTGIRCLQYIFVYTRQLTVVSPFWWVLFPFLLAWIPGSLSAFFPLVIVCLLLHASDTTKSLRMRITTGLPIFWLIWILDAWFSPIPFVVLNILAAGFGLYFCYSITTETSVSHKMDYIPVFVWIKKNNDEWVLESAVWDIWHYLASRETIEQLTTNFWARIQFGGFVEKKKRLRLAMDNPWHSLYKRPRKIWFILVMVVGSIIAVFILLSDIYLFPESWYILHPRNASADIIVLLIVNYFAMWLRFESPFIKKEKDIIEDAEKLLKIIKDEQTANEEDIVSLWDRAEFMPLCEENLKFLWNMVPKEDIDAKRGRFGRAVTRVSDRVHRRPNEVKQARLIVISKLQNPFIGDWTTFLD